MASPQSSSPNSGGSGANVFAATERHLQKSRTEKIASFMTLSMGLLLIAPVLLILGYIFYEASGVLSLDYILDSPEEKGTKGGIWLPLIGTFYLVFTSLFLVAPLGILSAIYLNEYAQDNWFTRLINISVTSLAGVPSIVHGLFGVGAFVHTLHLGKSLMAAACTIAVMTIPVIITATRESLNAVPMPFREACWNMGASRWQTVRTVVLPNSVTGILTGVILEIARAAGETAPILFTGATASLLLSDNVNPLMPFYLNERFMALSYHLHYVAEKVSSMPEEMKYGCAAILIGLILVINSVSITLRIWLRSRKKW